MLQFHTAMASFPDEGFAWSPGGLGIPLAHRPFQPWGSWDWHLLGRESPIPSWSRSHLLDLLGLTSIPSLVGECQPWLWLVWGYRCGDSQQAAPHKVSSVLLCIICTQPSAASKLVKLQFLRSLSSLSHSRHVY